jgi:ribonuclease BN (tRNA processing enzyme)
MIHDAQYVASDMPARKGWGHSQVAEVLDLGRQAEIGGLALYHPDPERDDDALDAIGAGRWAWAHAPGMRTIVAREGLSFDLAGNSPGSLEPAGEAPSDGPADAIVATSSF